MAPVTFEVTADFEASPRAVWDALVDWKGHEAWVPATRVEVEGGTSSAVGTRFTAWTGPGRLSLEDRMEVTVCAWDDDDQTGTCEVTKLGPVLSGRAGFTVTARGEGARVEWFEDVALRRVPGFLSPLVARLGAAGFRHAMRRLDRHLKAGHPAVAGTESGAVVDRA